MQDLQDLLRRETEDCSPLLKVILNEVLARPGKGLRGRLLSLAGETGRPDKKRLCALAAGVEVLHLATLVHDDLLDRGELRRGYPALWQQYGEKTAVLVGDYLFAAAYKILAFAAGPGGFGRIDRLLKAMVEAELEQEADAFKFIPVPVYLQRVEKKTAFFFQTICELGAEAGGLAREFQVRLGRFGLNTGMAYQLLDDLLDLVDDVEQTGKPAFQDLKNGVFTLPVLLLRPKNRLQTLLPVIREKKEVPAPLRATVRRLLVEQGVLLKTRLVIEEYLRQAEKFLPAAGRVKTRPLLEFLDGLRQEVKRNLTRLQENPAAGVLKAGRKS